MSLSEESATGSPLPARWFRRLAAARTATSAKVLRSCGRESSPMKPTVKIPSRMTRPREVSHGKPGMRTGSAFPSRSARRRSASWARRADVHTRRHVEPTISSRTGRTFSGDANFSSTVTTPNVTLARTATTGTRAAETEAGHRGASPAPLERTSSGRHRRGLR